MSAPRPMLPFEEPDVRALTRRCHPTWPAPEDAFFVAFPTLVLEVEEEIVGCTSFGIGLSPTGKGWTMYGRDVCVDPSIRGNGFGFLLHTARLVIAAQVGCLSFVGMTWRDNRAMIRIFEETGATLCGEEPGYYAHNDPPADGLLYIGPVRK